jgi:hypothetical protein
MSAATIAMTCQLDSKEALEARESDNRLFVSI